MAQHKDFEAVHESDHWPSSTPGHTPYVTYRCRHCGYNFRKRMYGSFQIGYDPHQVVDDLIAAHDCKGSRREKMD